MRLARPYRDVLRAAFAPAFAALLSAAAGCSSSTTAPPPPLPPISRVDLQPAADSLTVGDSFFFVPTAYDTNDVALAGIKFTWTSTVPGVVSVASNGAATAIGEGSTLVIASVGGQSDTSAIYVAGQQAGWYTQTSSTARNLYGVWFQPDGRTGFAVGALGTIVATGDAGAHWTSITSGTPNDLNSVFFTSTSVGWAVGDAGVVLKTTDGGERWSRMLNVFASEHLMCVRFVDANHGWIVGSNGVVIRTNDGGGSWTRIHPSAVTLNSVAFSDTTNGWAVGGSGIILGTHDGGRTWYLVQPAVTGLALNAAWRASNEVAWVVGAAGAKLTTAATADSFAWNVGTFGASNEMRGLVFVDDLTGYSVGANGGGVVFRTLDGGANWTQQLANSAQALNAVWFVDVMRGWAVGDQGRIVHTSSGGNQ